MPCSPLASGAGASGFDASNSTMQKWRGACVRSVRIGRIKGHGLDHLRAGMCIPGTFPMTPNPCNSQIATTMKTTTLSTRLMAAAVYRSRQLESPPFSPQAQCDGLRDLNILFSREHLKPRIALRVFHAWAQIPRHFDIGSRSIVQRGELVTWRTKRIEPELRCSERSDKLMLCVPWEGQEFGDYEDLRTSPGSRRAN
jgi:hypothetical protein